MGTTRGDYGSIKVNIDTGNREGGAGPAGNGQQVAGGLCIGEVSVGNVWALYSGGKGRWNISGLKVSIHPARGVEKYLVIMTAAGKLVGRSLLSTGVGRPGRVDSQLAHWLWVGRLLSGGCKIRCRRRCQRLDVATSL
jgi:hypothetical protein